MDLQSLKNKYLLFRGLINGREAKSDPFFLDIDITNRCNLRCVGCIYHSPEVTPLALKNDGEKDISFDMIERLCIELDFNKTPAIILQGAGEPLLHPDIIRIIRMIKDKGFRTTIITNGTLLNPEMNERLVDSGLDVLKLSLWATSPEQYKQNYPGSDPDNFNRIKESLQHLKRLKSDLSVLLPRLHVYFPINRNNFKTMDEIIRLAAEWDCENFIFAPMADITDELNDVTLTEIEERSVHETLARLKKELNRLGIQDETDLTFLRYRLRDELWKYFPCTIAWYHARIRVDGTVQSCGRCDSEVNFGNLNEKSFREIWNSREIQEFRYQRLWQQRNEYWGEHCACTSCCFVKDMNRINNVFKWIRPALRLFRNRSI